MDVHVVASTREAYKVQFGDAGSGIKVVIGIAIPLMNRWNIYTNQLMSTATVLFDEILQNHDMNQPLREEYLFIPENSGLTLDATIDQIRARPL
jgi:hypothetical protein